MNKKLKIGLSLMLVAMLSAGITYALVTIQKPVTHTIEIIGTYNLELFADKECTIPFEPAIDYGQVQRTTTERKGTAFYVKNTGDETLYSHWETSGLPAGWTLTETDPWLSANAWAENEEVTLQPGENRCCQFTVHMDLTDYPVGTVTWTTTFYAYDTPQTP